MWVGDLSLTRISLPPEVDDWGNTTEGDAVKPPQITPKGGVNLYICVPVVVCTPCVDPSFVTVVKVTSRERGLRGRLFPSEPLLGEFFCSFKMT